MLTWGLVAASQSALRAGAAAEAGQFDFCVGEWEVRAPDGRLQGSSRIVRVANGQGLLEEWRPVAESGRAAATSLQVWNRRTGQWQQLWTRADGVVLELSGGLERDGQMVLTGEQEENGARVLNRLTWTPQPEGNVRRLWEQSTDDGQQWRVVLDGRYERRKAKLASGGANHSRALLYLLQ